MSEAVRLKWLLKESDVRAEAEAGNLPLLSVSISSGVRRRDESTMTTRAASEDLSKYKICRAGDLVINRMRAFQGALGIAPEDGVVSPDYAVLRVDPQVDKRWLNYYLTSGYTVSTMASMVRGIGGTEAGNVRTPRLNVSDLRSMSVPRTSVKEQSTIADYLDRETARIDTLIEEQQRLIEMLRERRIAIVAHATSQGSEVEFRRVIAELRQGWSPNCENWPADGIKEWGVLKVGCANTGRFASIQNKRLPDDETPRPELAVRQGELVMSRSNTKELVGAASVVDRDYPRLLLSDLTYGISLSDEAHPPFVAYSLMSPALRMQISAASKGMSHSMQKISQRDIRELRIQLPSIEEQRRIAAHLDGQTSKIDQLIAETQRFIELSLERRSALIAAAVTGQIDVRKA